WDWAAWRRGRARVWRRRRHHLNRVREGIRVADGERPSGDQFSVVRWRRNRRSAGEAECSKSAGTKEEGAAHHQGSPPDVFRGEKRPPWPTKPLRSIMRGLFYPIQ